MVQTKCKLSSTLDSAGSGFHIYSLTGEHTCRFQAGILFFSVSAFYLVEQVNYMLQKLGSLGQMETRDKKTTLSEMKHS